MTQNFTDLRATAQTVSSHLPGLVLSAEQLAAMVSPGEHGQRRSGAGEDFWQYRPAGQSDTVRSIDWRRSARSDAQYVRDREAQTAQTVGLWVSAGQGMDYTGSTDRPSKLAHARLIALALGMVLLRGGERVGLIGQSAGSGRVQADRLAQALISAPRPDEDGDALPPELLRPNQRLLIISDFLTDPIWLQDVLARSAALGVTGAVMQILDPDEEEFPFTGAVVFHSLSGMFRHDSRDAAGLRTEYKQRLAARRDWLQAQANGAGWHFGCHRTDHAPAEALNWLYQVLEG